MAKSVTGATSASLPNVDQKPKPWQTGKGKDAGLNHKRKKRRGMGPNPAILQALMQASMAQPQQQQMQAPMPQQPLQMPPQAMSPYGR